MNSLAARYLLLSFLLLVLGRTPIAKNLQSLAAPLVLPLQYGLSVSAQNVKKPLLFFKELTALKKDKEKLRSRIEDLEGQILKLENVVRENELLREQGQIVNDLPLAGKTVLARVVGRFFTEGAYLLLDRGTDAGIKEGLPVIFKNFLIGETINVTRRSARVRSILDPRFRAPAVSFDAPSRPRGVVRGEYSTGLLMEKILPSERVNIGERIVTSGEGGYPANLLIGRVKEISTGAADVLKWARLEPLVDINALNQVFVVIE